ncbi:hypothetical protein C2845_PM07G12060 [Panicum miliaceum]|uniref:Piezo-type mechanosensitive ion channel homolog domain-containing protein n=1 Tax=Panicum miliaceum TaxID=4540 RepID=A0A3L6ST91_PANMI|nr:hypothetical protein C2845_PM07G12060 [Panicum miliaceum]
MARRAGAAGFLLPLVLLAAQVTFHIIWCIEGMGWSVAYSWWVKLVGLARGQPWESPSVIYFLALQLSATVLALVEVLGSRLHQDSCWLNFSFGFEQIGYHLRFPYVVLAFADFIGLFKVSSKSEWPELSSGISLLVYYFMLSSVKQDIQETDSLISLEDGSLTEHLLPSGNVFFSCQSRSDRRHTNILLRGSVFRNFSINFFTYGFPVLLLALAFWSFNFTSICAFGLLAYVGYILYAFPSLFQMHRLNGSLLVFILLWAASTYVFNVAFTFFNKRFQKDMKIWETVGLWHYSIPGLFLLAQFCLGVFVALCNLVNNSVFLYVQTVDGPSSSDDHLIDGLSNNATTKDFIEIGSIVCFCAVHSHGFKMLFSLSAVLQHTPCPPVGFTILKAGLNKSVLLSVYSSQSSRNDEACRNSHGIIADDPRMLISYYVVFIFSSFKLRSDRFSGFSDSDTYHEMMSQRKNAVVWRDLSLETKSFWTFLDYVRLYAYCHLLDIVLALIAITGTLEYDVLHLGYLGFALVFFRMRLEILKKKNKIFKYLRMYNFVLIVLSLAYQSPYVGQFSSGTCDQIDYLYEIIGFYKYDYGFKIASRSAFVEIVIFLLVSVQSYIFSSGEFDYVSRYLEAEQIGAMVREQEKKALKKTEQLQHLRRSEEHKRQWNMQVERMKSEMYNLQSQLNRMNSFTPINDTSYNEGLRRRRNTKLYSDTNTPDVGNETGSPTKQDKIGSTESAQSFEFSVTDTQKNIRNLMFQGSPDTMRSPIRGRSDEFVLTDNIGNFLGSTPEITELEESDEKVNYNLSKWEKAMRQPKENPLKSAVQLIGDGVSQVQSFGNQAVTNIVSFLNIDPDEPHSNEHPAEGDIYDVVESQTETQDGQLLRTHSVSDTSGTTVKSSMPIGVIFRALLLPKMVNGFR